MTDTRNPSSTHSAEAAPKKILFLTGTRAEFGKMKSLIQAVDATAGFDYEIFATGMHLMQRYGSTYIEIEKSGFKHIHKFHNQHIDEPMEMILANTIQGLSRYVHETRPDMLVVHGDRVEALAGAIVGSMNNILVAHIEGGERSGTIDELIRHSVSKLSHLHLVSNTEAANRILQMGEHPDTVHIIGSADIDVMKNPALLPSLDEVKRYYDIPFTDYHVVMFHPVTTEVAHMKQHAEQLVQALIDSQQNYILIYPNNDHGTNEILDAYEVLKGNAHFKIFPSIRFEYFLTLIHHAYSLIGNSSAGIREAPIFGVPSINIGSRQNNRFKSDSIIDVGYGSDAILASIRSVSADKIRHPACEYFGDGNSAQAFTRLIQDPNTWAVSPQKIFNDIQSDGASA